MRTNTITYTCNNMVDEATIHQYIDERLQGDTPHDNEFYMLCKRMFMANLKNKGYWTNDRKDSVGFNTMDDLFHSVMTAVYEKLHSYNKRYTFANWFYQVCTDTLKTVFEKEEKKILCVSLYETVNNGDAQREYGEMIADQDFSEGLINTICISEILETMQENYRQAFRLKYLNKLRTKEVAKILGVTESTANNWIYRGKKAFSDHFSEVAPELVYWLEDDEYDRAS